MLAELEVIVPVLNEAALVTEALTELHRALTTSPFSRWRIWVADAGSRDGTVDKIRTVVSRDATRWRFVNDVLSRPSIARTVTLALAALAKEPPPPTTWTLILPIDCRLPESAWGTLASIPREVQWGGFCKTYRPGSPLMRAYACLQNVLRSRFLHHLVWTNGIFLRYELLEHERLPDLGFLDDVAWVDGLRRQTHRFRLLGGPISVDARRYRGKGLARIFLNACILFAYRTGLCSVEKLRDLYRADAVSPS